MNRKVNGNGVMHVNADQKKNMWVRLAGAAALLTLGYILYRKRQTGLGSALMTSSLNVLTGSVPEA